MPTAIRSQPLAADKPVKAVPVLPTLVVASYKGGVWKTSLAVAIAERLAFAGLSVLLVTSDSQEDARARLGVRASDPQVARVTRGPGTVTVIGARDEKAIDILYRPGLEKLGLGRFDVAVVDTPPAVKGGALPGVLMVATVDGTDAARNLITMLRSTPQNTEIVLVKVHREDVDQWGSNAAAIEEASGRSMLYLPTPLPKAAPVSAAHDDGRSVWSLPRRGCTLEFLSGVDGLASMIWAKVSPKKSWPEMPSPGAASIHVAGWDDDEA